MTHNQHEGPDYGTGQKKLSIYLLGVVICLILTFISFATVKILDFPRAQEILILYVSAVIQFFVQLFCFLRINVQTSQGQLNVLSFVFTLVVLTSIIAGSLWIMLNLNYNMI